MVLALREELAVPALLVVLVALLVLVVLAEGLERRILASVKVETTNSATW